jgi:hypothetical protein
MTFDVKFSVGLVIGALIVFVWYRMREQKG